MKLHWLFAALIGAAALLLLVGAEKVPLLDPDESRFARTSLEMLRDHDLVVPHFGGEPRLAKPPLLHWIQAFLFGCCGVGEIVARLPSALATLGSIALVGWVAARCFGGEAGLWAAACLGTMPLVVVLGRLGTTDALLSLHVLAVVALDLAGRRDTRHQRELVIGCLLGLAFLIKGPVGVLLPLLLLLGGRAAAGTLSMPSAGSLLYAAAGFCLVALPWSVAFMRRVGFTNVWKTLREEALDRYFAGTVHVEPPWFYVPVAAAGTLPWLGPLLVGLVRIVRRRGRESARTASYAAAALLTGLLFFTLGRSKLPSYILPLAPLAALVVTWEIGQELRAPRERTAGPALLAATLAACAIVLALFGTRSAAGPFQRVSVAGAIVLACGALPAGWAALARRPRWAYGVTAATSGVFLALTLALALPTIGERRSAAGLVAHVPELHMPRPLATVDMQVPSLVFYLDRAPEVVGLASLEERLARADDPLLVFDVADLPAVSAAARAALETVGSHGKYVVFQRKRASADPAASPPP